MERNPHLLIEGCAIGCYAIGAKVAYIYIRGEFFHVQHVLERAIDEAYANGLSRQEHPRHRASTATSTCTAAPARTRRARRRRCSSRSKASARSRATSRRFRRVVGLYGMPDRGEQRRDALQRAARSCTNGAEWFAALGPEKNGGPKLYCVSGHVQAPGRLRSVDEHHAARADRRLRRRRARRPHAEGGDPRRIVGADPAARSARHAGELRRRAEGRLAARLGRRSSCSTTRPAWSGWRRTCCTSTATSRAASARRAARAPTGCYKILQRIERGEGQMRDLDLLVEHRRATSPARRCARSATPR